MGNVDPFEWLRAGRKDVESDSQHDSLSRDLPKLLHEHVQKGYDREIDDNESIWRSLPLFAVLIGFAGASLNFLASLSFAPDQGPWAFVVYALIAIDVCLYGWAVRHLMVTVMPRRHRYIANDREVRQFGIDLLAFYRGTGLAESASDAAATADVQTYLIEQLAEASSQIRVLNQKKAHARAQALFWLSLGFIFWFLASSAIIVERKIFEPEGGKDGTQRKSEARTG